MAVKKTSKKSLKKSASKKKAAKKAAKKAVKKVAKKGAKKAPRKPARRKPFQTSTTRVSSPVEPFREPEPFRFQESADSALPGAVTEKSGSFPLVAVLIVLLLVGVSLFIFRGGEETHEDTTSTVVEPPPSETPSVEMQQEQQATTVTEAPAVETPPVVETPATTGRTYTVKAGDSLYGIAKAQLGSGARHKEILELNRDVLPSASKLKPGLVLKLPAR